MTFIIKRWGCHSCILLSEIAQSSLGASITVTLLQVYKPYTLSDLHLPPPKMQTLPVWSMPKMLTFPVWSMPKMLTLPVWSMPKMLTLPVWSMPKMCRPTSFGISNKWYYTFIHDHLKYYIFPNLFKRYTHILCACEETMIVKFHNI